MIHKEFPHLSQLDAEESDDGVLKAFWQCSLQQCANSIVSSIAGAVIFSNKLFHCDCGQSTFTQLHNMYFSIILPWNGNDIV